RRKHNRIAPLEAVLHGLNAVAHGVVGPGVDVAALAGAVVLARNQAIVGARVDNLRIAGVGRNPAALTAAHIVPVALGDAGGRSAGGDAHRGVVLLRAIGVVWKVLVQRHAVELRRRLVHEAGPRAASIGCDGGAAIVALDHAIGIVRRDPERVIVAMRRVQRGVSVAAINRAVYPHVEDVDCIGAARVGEDVGVIPGALAQNVLLVDAGPGAAAVF